MKHLLIILMLCPVYLIAQTGGSLSGGTPDIVNVIEHLSDEGMDPADSSALAGGTAEVTLEILLTDPSDINKLHVSYGPASALSPASQVYDMSNLTVWEKGTKQNPEGYAVYIKLGRKPITAPRHVSVQPEKAGGARTSAFSTTLN